MGVAWAPSVGVPETFSAATAWLGTSACCAGVTGRVLGGVTRLAPCWLVGTLGTSSHANFKLGL